MTAVLEARGLTRRLPTEVPVTLVEDIDLTVEAGEFMAIMGPSGSGKSSLLYLLGLLDRPSGGQVWLAGRETAGFGEKELARLRLVSLGFVFQFHFLLAEFTAEDNVLLPMRKLAKLAPAAARERARALLDALGLGEHAQKYPHQLSGGERQRVAIARALANEPLVILADEPTGNLDSAASATVREIFRSLASDEGRTIIAVTHDPEFAAAADRHIGLVDGRIDPDWRPPVLPAE